MALERNFSKEIPQKRYFKNNVDRQILEIKIDVNLEIEGVQ
jgi:hypothetical protein